MIRPAPAPARPEVGVAAQAACLLEAAAPKPGNVHPGADFADVRFEDYLLSAAAIGPVMADAGKVGVGETILRAVRDTKKVVAANTNLGIVLLLAPLARAAALADLKTVRAPAEALRDRLGRVLADLTVEDARAAYAAIREAAPGGLGSAPEEDVAGEPTVTLREAMELAGDRDSIAHEYATDYGITFAITAPALEAARRDGLGWPDAVVQAYLQLLAEVPDTLIARKQGRAVAEQVSDAAHDVLEAGGVRTDAGREAIARFDAQLREGGNARNPGTTADLVAAGLFVLWWTQRGSV